MPEELPRQIDANETNWRGQVEHRLRLDLQYEDAADILRSYAQGSRHAAPAQQTRSITNIANAYDVIAEFLGVNFDDPGRLRAFYGYLTNKVILIRIMTPSVATALTT